MTKICRLPEVQDKLREVKERLLAEADDWTESINFAVTHETDGSLAYRLLKDFAVIPTREQLKPRRQKELIA